MICFCFDFSPFAEANGKESKSWAEAREVIVTFNLPVVEPVETTCTCAFDKLRHRLLTSLERFIVLVILV